jgi:hypothetical protein
MRNWPVKVFVLYGGLNFGVLWAVFGHLSLALAAGAWAGVGYSKLFGHHLPRVDQHPNPATTIVRTTVMAWLWPLLPARPTE